MNGDFRSMDKYKLESAQTKMQNLSFNERCACLYQWILTKHIKLDEFKILLEWCEDHQSPIIELTGLIDGEYAKEHLISSNSFQLINLNQEPIPIK